MTWNARPPSLANLPFEGDFMGTLLHISESLCVKYFHAISICFFYALLIIYVNTNKGRIGSVLTHVRVFTLEIIQYIFSDIHFHNHYFTHCMNWKYCMSVYVQVAGHWRIVWFQGELRFISLIFPVQTVSPRQSDLMTLFPTSPIFHHYAASWLKPHKTSQILNVPSISAFSSHLFVSLHCRFNKVWSQLDMQIIIHGHFGKVHAHTMKRNTCRDTSR